LVYICITRCTWPEGYPRGIYVAPFLRNFNIAEHDFGTDSPWSSDYKPPSSGMLNAFGGGVMIGWQAIANNISFDIFLGPGFYDVIHHGISGDSNGLNFLPRVGFAIGIAL